MTFSDIFNTTQLWSIQKLEYTFWQKARLWIPKTNSAIWEKYKENLSSSRSPTSEQKDLNVHTNQRKHIYELTITADNKWIPTNLQNTLRRLRLWFPGICRINNSPKHCVPLQKGCDYKSQHASARDTQSEFAWVRMRGGWRGGFRASEGQLVIVDRNNRNFKVISSCDLTTDRGSGLRSWANKPIGWEEKGKQRPTGSGGGGTAS